jgi:hypothetical protein
VVLAGSARAASITWQFEGMVRLVDLVDPDSGALQARLASLGATVGGPVSGLVTFESSTPNERPGAEYPDFDSGKYPDAATGASLSFALGSLSLAPDLSPSDPEDPSRSIFMGTTTRSAPDMYGSFLFQELDLEDPTGVIQFPLFGLELASLDPALFDPQCCRSILRRSRCSSRSRRSNIPRS